MQQKVPDEKVGHFYYAKILSSCQERESFRSTLFQKGRKGYGGGAPENTLGALRGVNTKTVLWTVLVEGRLCKREPLL